MSQESVLDFIIEPFLDHSWPARLELGEFSLYLLIVLGACLFFFWHAFRHFYKARTIQDTPASKIRSAVQGYVELSGQAIEAPLISPLSQTPCAWYRYTVAVDDGEGSRTVAKGCSHSSIAMKDNTGICYLDVDQADIQTSSKTWMTKNPLITSSPGCLPHLNLFGLNSYRCTEYLITPNDTLYVVGRFYSIPPRSDAEQLNNITQKILNEWKKDRANLLARFDHNTDGEIDFDEWEKAREAAMCIAKERLEKERNTETIHRMTSSKIMGQPYIISTKKQEKLVAYYKLYAGVSLVVFLFFLSEVALYTLARLS